MIELPAAMVRDIDYVDAMLDGEFGVLGGGNAFDDQRHAGDFLDLLGHLPGEHRLIDAPALAMAARRLPAIEQRPLAPAVVRRVYGQAKRDVTGFLDASDDLC